MWRNVVVCSVCNFTICVSYSSTELLNSDVNVTFHQLIQWSTTSSALAPLCHISCGEVKQFFSDKFCPNNYVHWDVEKATRRGLRVSKTVDLTHFPNTSQQRNASRQQTVRRAVHVISPNKSNRPDNQIPQTGLTKLGHNIHANFVVRQRSVDVQHASPEDALSHTHTKDEESIAGIFEVLCFS